MSLRNKSAWLASLVISVTLVTASAALHAESLYNESTFRPLTADNKAFRVGDLLTVQVYENSSASTSSDTGTRRKNNLQADLAHGSRRAGEVAMGVGADFDGGGRTQRANKVLITLSVSVRDVFPNGDLKIAGEQLLLVNEEQQRVTLEGRVRPQDVSEGNLVMSTRIADARITYLGDGELSQRQQRAWWRKWLDWAGM